MESIECRYCPRICAEFYYRRGATFPSAEGWHDTGPRENAIFVGGCAGVVIVPPPPQNAAVASEPLLAKIINCLFVE